MTETKGGRNSCCWRHIKFLKDASKFLSDNVIRPLDCKWSNNRISAEFSVLKKHYLNVSQSLLLNVTQVFNTATT